MTNNLSKYNTANLPKTDAIKHQRYAVVVADWNSDVTYAMADAAIHTLMQHGVERDNIIIKHVPGTVELTYAATRLMEDDQPQAIIVIGCVIKGDTPHFDYVCQAVTQGVTILNAKGICPVIFSVLTTLDKQQALDRAGGKLGNKGVEGAVTAILMANI